MKSISEQMESELSEEIFEQLRELARKRPEIYAGIMYAERWQLPLSSALAIAILHQHDINESLSENMERLIAGQYGSEDWGELFKRMQKEIQRLSEALASAQMREEARRYNDK